MRGTTAGQRRVLLPASRAGGRFSGEAQGDEAVAGLIPYRPRPPACGRVQIQKIMGDLQEEARRINAAAGAAAGAAGSSGGSGAAAEEQEASGGKRRGKHGQAAGDAPATPTLAQQRQGKKHLLAHVTPLD